MFDKVPPALGLLIIAAIVLAGPIICFAFIFGGLNAGLGAILVLFFLFVGLYIFIGRRYYT